MKENLKEEVKITEEKDKKVEYIELLYEFIFVFTVLIY
jgi:low temperature requirement protein LtrA